MSAPAVFDFDAIRKVMANAPEPLEPTSTAKPAPACETCNGAGWIDESLGGIATSGWVVCPDCENPEKLDHP